MTIREYRQTLMTEANFCFDILESKRCTAQEKQDAASDLDDIRRELNYLEVFSDYPDLPVSEFHALVSEAEELYREHKSGIDTARFEGMYKEVI